jgi:hypothetical protein
MPVPMQIFQAWFIALHAALLPDKQVAEKYLDQFPGIQRMTREQQKRGAAGCILRCSNDHYATLASWH